MPRAAASISLPKLPQKPTVLSRRRRQRPSFRVLTHRVTIPLSESLSDSLTLS